MAPQQFFSQQWAARVEEVLFSRENEGGCATSNDKLPRVRKSVLSENEKAYIPESFSLGHYHNRNFQLQEDSAADNHCDELRKMSTNEEYKIKSAARFLRKCTDRKILDDIFAMIGRLRPKIESFYSLSPIADSEYSKNFDLMMTVDSFFLLYFLSGLHREHNVSIKCDILKLENQIPLFVLNEVFEKVRKAFDRTECFVVDINGTEPLLPKMYWAKILELSPFDLLGKIAERTITKQPHLLACMHAIVSQFMKFQHFPAEPTRLQKISSFIGQYVVEKVCSIFFCTAGELPIKSHTPGELAMAGELAKAGIKFKPLSDININIRFDKYSLTIYLPQMTITSAIQTEVFFRNLLEWEHVAGQGSCLNGFINLMLCLIYTADDVLVLRKSCVISPQSSLTDEEIAKLWDNMRQSSGGSSPVLELKKQLDEVLLKRYYRTKIIIKINEKMKVLSKLFDEFRKLYFSKPWKAIALLVGTFILVMNMVVAYCTLWGCNSDSYMKSSGSVVGFVY